MEFFEFYTKNLGIFVFYPHFNSVTKLKVLFLSGIQAGAIVPLDDFIKIGLVGILYIFHIIII